MAAAPTETAAAPNFEGTAPPSRSKQLIDQLAAMIELPPPGVPPQQDDIIADELSRASENIERRVQRRQRTFTLASGPSDGDYACADPPERGDTVAHVSADVEHEIARFDEAAVEPLHRVAPLPVAVVDA